MKPVGGAKICRILATTTGFITRWTSKNINFYIYISFLDHFYVLIVIILC